MTLSPNSLPAEPSTTACDLLAACGVPAQSPNGTPPGAPFASLLTQADTGNPAAGAPASDFSAAANIVPASLTPGVQPSVTEAPVVLYPGAYYMPQVGPAQAALLEGMPRKTPSSESQPMGGPLKKDKSKTSEKSETAPSADASQGSLALAYQFIAGQWLPQQPVPPTVPQQTSDVVDNIQVGLGGLPGGNTASVGMDYVSLETKQTGGNPESEQQAAYVPSADQAKTVKALDQVGKLSEPMSVGTNGVVAVKPDLKQPAISVSQKIDAFDPAGGRSVPMPAETDAAAVAAKSNSKQAAVSALPKTEKPTDAPELAAQTPDAATSTVLSADAAGTLNLGRRFSSGRTALAQAPEKFAASGASGLPDSASGVNSSTDPEQKKSLFIDGKSIIDTSKKIGTSTANREIAMPYSVANKAFPAAFSSPAGNGIEANISPDTKVDALLSTQAPRLVQEIHAIADRISSIDRNSVEVRFDFSETDRLSVRVEYRDGTVHTTFRTDSGQLREAVAHEWQTQSVSAQQRNYRMADPVFAQTSPDRQNFSGDSSGRQRAFEQQAQSGSPSFGFSGRNAGSTPSVAAPAARSARPETSLHLHALA